MPKYVVDGKTYAFTEDIGQEEAEKIVASRNQIAESKEEEYDPEKYEGFFQEAAEGIVGGVGRMIEGAVTTGTSLFDLAADTNYTDKVIDKAEEIRKDLGIDPAGLTGTIVEGLVQYGIPGLGAASAVSKIGRLSRAARGVSEIGKKKLGSKSKKTLRKLGKTGIKKPGQLTRSQKFGEAARQIGAAGVADTIVATDNTQVIADFFEQSPDVLKTDQEVGLEGRERAGQILFNKFRVGVEGAAIQTVAPTAFGLAGKGLIKAGAARIPGTKISAGEVATFLPKKGVEKVGQAITNQRDRVLSGKAGLGRESGVFAEDRLLGKAFKSLDETVADTVKIFRFGGYLPEDAARAKALANPAVESAIKKAQGNLKEIDKDIKTELLKNNRQRTKYSKQKLVNNFMEVLEGKKQGDISGMSPRMFKIYKRAKDQIDDLSKALLKTEAVKQLADPEAFAKSVRENINQGGYLKRMYRIFQDRNFKLTAVERRAIVKNIEEGKGIDLQHIKGILADTDIPLSTQQLGPTATRQGITKKQAELYINQVTQGAKLRGSNLGGSGRIASIRVNPAIVNRRSVPGDVLRSIYGEITTPQEAYVSTVAELTNFIAADNFYSVLKRTMDDHIADAAATGKKQVYFDTQQILKQGAPDGNLDNLSMEDATKILKNWKENHPGYVILGRDGLGAFDTSPKLQANQTAFGSMFGYAVPQPMWNSMSSKFISDEDTFPMLVRKLYAPFLKAKSISQYSKTILSPITQVRNVTSAAMFAVMQGNVGKGASIFESSDIVLKDIFGLGSDEQLEFLVEMQKRGVIGSSAELREVQDNLRKGLGFRDDQAIEAYQRSVAAGEDAGSADPAFAIKARSKGAQFIKAPFDLAENMYRAGDDVWKIYNYKFELSKIQQARRKMINGAQGDANKIAQANKDFDVAIGRKEGDTVEEAMKTYSADLVRNLVPNYELVPEIIRGLRKLPLGNFIAFPAEILRTGFNTLDTAMKELSSNSSTIREIGMRRLMGAITATTVVGKGLQEFGKTMTDTSQDQIDAANRLGAEWQRNSQLIPIGRDENGDLEFIDFSHTNPYDLISKPFYAVTKSLRQSSKLDKDGVDTAKDAAFEALREYYEPFLGISMVFDAVADVMPKKSFGRAGETASGAKVYRDGDSFGKVMEKSIVHISNTLMPNAVPLRVPVGAETPFFNPVKPIELGRFARGVFDPDSVEATTGRKYKRGSELFRAFTGLNSQVVDSKRVLTFKANEFKDARSTAATNFNQLSRFSDTTDDQWLNAYMQADDARLKAFRNFKLHVDDLITLGMDESDIRRQLRSTDNRLGKKEISGIMNDRYTSFTPSKEVIKNARRKGLEIPISEINDLRRIRNGMQLTPEEPIDKFDLDNFNIQKPPANTNPKPTPPVSNNVGPVSSTPAILQPFANNATARRPNGLSGLLGSNPEDVLKNMEVARRTV